MCLLVTNMAGYRTRLLAAGFHSIQAKYTQQPQVTIALHRLTWCFPCHMCTADVAYMWHREHTPHGKVGIMVGM